MFITNSVTNQMFVATQLFVSYGKDIDNMVHLSL